MEFNFPASARTAGAMCEKCLMFPELFRDGRYRCKDHDMNDILIIYTFGKKDGYKLHSVVEQKMVVEV